MHRVLLTIAIVLLVIEAVVLYMVCNGSFTVEEYNTLQETIIDTAIISLVATGIGWLAGKLVNWACARLFTNNTNGGYNEEM